MLIIPINEDQNQIDRVLKRYKKKIEKTGVLRKLKQRKERFEENFLYKISE